MPHIFDEQLEKMNYCWKYQNEIVSGHLERWKELCPKLLKMRHPHYIFIMDFENFLSLLA